MLTSANVRPSYIPPTRIRIRLRKLDSAGLFLFKFVLFSALWIIVTDHVLRITQANSVIAAIPIDTFKGILYITLAGGFVFSVIQKLQGTLVGKHAEQKDFFNNCLMPILIVDPENLVILNVNQAAVEFYRFDKSQLCGKPLQSLQREPLAMKPGHTQQVTHIVGDIFVPVFQRCQHFEWEEKVVYAIHISPNFQLAEAPAKRITELEKLVIDLRAQLKLANAGLSPPTPEGKDRENAEDISTINVFEQIGDAQWIFDVKLSRFRQLSSNAAELYGKPYAELLNGGFFPTDHIHPNDRELRIRHLEKLFKTNKAEFHYRIVPDNGNIRWLFTRMILERNSAGEPMLIRGTTSLAPYYRSAEELIQKTIRNLTSVFRNMQEQFVILDRDGNVVNYNRMAEEQHHLYSRPLEREQDFFSFVSPQFADQLRNAFEHLCKSKEPFRQEINIKHSNDHDAWYAIAFIPVLDPHGVLQHVCFSGIDISERKRMAAEVKVSRNNLHTLINNTDDLLWSVDPDRRFITMNAAVANFFREELDITVNERDPFPLTGLFDEKWSNGFASAFSGLRINLRGEFIDKRGFSRYYEAALNPILENDAVTGVSGVFRDVTMQKHVLRKSVEVNRKYKLLSKATNDAIWELDVNRNRIYWNRGLVDIFGLKASDVLTLEDWKFRVHPEEVDRISKEIENALTSGDNQWSTRFRFCCANNEYKHILSRSFIEYDNGRAVRLIGSMQDITSLVTAESNARLANERYRFASRAAGDIVYDHNLLSDTIDWNESYSTVLGYPSLQGSGRDWISSVHPEDAEAVITSWMQAVSAGKDTWRGEYRYRKCDGTFAYVLDRGYVVRDDSGTPVRFVGAMVDLTHKMRSIAEIRKLSLVASKTGNMVMICDGQLNIDWVNTALKKKLRWSAESPTTLPTFLQSFHVNSFVAANVVNKLNQDIPVRDELELVIDERQTIWVAVDASRIIDEAGMANQYILIFSDITEQKIYERKLVSIARELSTLIEYANAVIFGIDRNGYVNEWNAVTTNVTGYAKNEVLGRKALFGMIEEHLHESVSAMLHAVLEGKSASNIELTIHAKNNEKTKLLISATPRRDASGVITGVLFVGQDITELADYRTTLEQKVEERTRELNKALKQEIELANMKKRFVSVASHEFRTPLSTINFSAAYLRRHRAKISQDEVEQKLLTIEQQVKQMNFLLEDVLTLSKAESGKIKVNRSEIELKSYLENLVEELLNGSGNSHEIDLNWSNFDKNFVLSSDSSLLRHIFVNLLNNAIKFSPASNRIEVTIWREEGMIKFKIQDYGIGIPECEIDRIFDAFHRAENASDIPGTGLGLNIVRHSIQLLDGRIDVSSKQGQGSTFTVKIPCTYV